MDAVGEFFANGKGPLQPLGKSMSGGVPMAVRVFGCNHIVIEIGDIEKAIAFYTDVFNLELLNDGEGDAFFKLGEHQISRHVRGRGTPTRPS